MQTFNNMQGVSFKVTKLMGTTAEKKSIPILEMFWKCRWFPKWTPTWKRYDSVLYYLYFNKNYQFKIEGRDASMVW